MKVGFFVFSILLILSSCGKDMSVEDQLFACMSDRFEEADIDLANTLDSLEEFLFNEKVIDSKDGKGLRSYFEKVVESNSAVPLQNNPFLERFGALKFDFEFSQKCLFDENNIDSTDYLNSTFGQLTRKVQDTVKQTGQISIGMISQVFLDNLTNEDLEHPFYRAYILLTIVFIADRDSSYIRRIPKKLDPEISPPKEVLKGAYTITIYPEGHLLNKEKEIITLDQLEKDLIVHLNIKDKKTHVRMEVFPATPYGLFADVQGVIEKSYYEVLNNIALKKHGRAYAELKEKQQDEIKKEYPLRLIEVSKQK